MFAPAEAGDHTDPQMVHLDGLNLSRAWCLRGIAGALEAGAHVAGVLEAGAIEEGDPRLAVLREAASVHLATGLPSVQSGDYMGEHWLATFAVYALTC